MKKSLTAIVMITWMVNVFFSSPCYAERNNTQIADIDKNACYEKTLKKTIESKKCKADEKLTEFLRQSIYVPVNTGSLRSNYVDNNAFLNFINNREPDPIIEGYSISKNEIEENPLLNYLMRPVAKGYNIFSEGCISAKNMEDAVTRATTFNIRNFTINLVGKIDSNKFLGGYGLKIKCGF